MEVFVAHVPKTILQTASKVVIKLNQPVLNLLNHPPVDLPHLSPLDFPLFRVVQQSGVEHLRKVLREVLLVHPGVVHAINAHGVEPKELVEPLDFSRFEVEQGLAVVIKFTLALGRGPLHCIYRYDLLQSQETNIPQLLLLRLVILHLNLLEVVQGWVMQVPVVNENIQIAVLQERAKRFIQTILPIILLKIRPNLSSFHQQPRKRKLKVLVCLFFMLGGAHF